MPNIYLLYGSEKVLMDEWLDSFIKKNVPEGKDDLNFSVIDLEEHPVQYLIQQAETIPFLGDYRIIIGQAADFFGAATGKQAHDIDRLLEFLENPPDFSMVVFKTKIDKLDKRKKITKYMESNHTVLVFNQLQGKDLDAWIKNKVKENGCTIDGDAIGYLIHTIGPNVTLLSNEIHKICLYVNQGTITSKEIQLLVPRTLEQNLFGLVDKIAQKKIDQGLQVIYDLLKNKESPVLIIHLLAKKFRTMLLAKDLYEKGYSPQQIATQLGQHPYSVKITLDQSRSFTNKNIRNMLILLAETDEQIKTGKLPDVLALETMILTLKNKI